MENQPISKLTTINILPNEILVMIIDALEFHDILMCSLVSYRWFAVVNEHKKIIRKLRLRIDKDYVTDIENSPHFVRNYSCVHIKSIQFTKMPDFAKNFPNAEALKFSRCEFDNKNIFIQILMDCNGLKTLDIFDSIILENTATEADVLCPGFTIENGILNFFDYHALKMINIFEGISLNFKTVKLKLLGTTSFDQFEMLFEHIDKHFSQELSDFTFGHNMSPQGHDKLFKYLSNMTKLRLKSLSIDEIPRQIELDEDENWFEQFLKKQNNLTSFELTNNVTADHFKCITKHLSELEVLSLMIKHENSFDYIMENLNCFKNLKILHLHLEKFKNNHNVVLDFLSELKKLERFSLEAWYLNSDILSIHVSSQATILKNMKSFSVRTLPEIWFYQLTMNDESAQQLFKCMPNLVALHLYKISGLTPSGMLGGTEANVERYSVAQLINLSSLSLDTSVVDEPVFLSFDFPRLKELVLRGKNKTLDITDAGLEKLARCSPHLKTIRTGRAIIYVRNKEADLFEHCHIPVSKWFSS